MKKRTAFPRILDRCFLLMILYSKSGMVRPRAAQKMMAGISSFLPGLPPLKLFTTELLVALADPENGLFVLILIESR